MCIVDNVRPRFKKFEFSNGRYPVQEESIDQIFLKGGHPFSNEGSVLRNPTMIASWYFSRTVKRWKSRCGAFHQRTLVSALRARPRLATLGVDVNAELWRGIYLMWREVYQMGRIGPCPGMGGFWNLKAWDIHWIVQVSRLDCYGRYFGCVMALWCSHKNQCARRTARRKRHIVSQLSFGFLTCSKGLKLMGCDWVVWRWDLGLRSNDFVCEGVTAQRWMVLKFLMFPCQSGFLLYIVPYVYRYIGHHRSLPGQWLKVFVRFADQVRWGDPCS